MKKLFTLCLFLTAMFCANIVKAQDIMKGEPGMYPEQIIFKNNAPAFKKGSVLVADATGKVTTSSNAKLNHSEKDNLGFEHFRYQQTYSGIPVELAVYVVHVTNAVVSSQNGKWVKDFPADLKTTASVNKTTALKNATAFIGAKTYKWELASEEAFIKREQQDPNATFFPKGELVY